MSLPTQLKQKEFVRVNKEIWVLKTYKAILADEYWAKWEKKNYKYLQPIQSWVSPDKPMQVATNLGYSGHERNLTVVLD